jgi:hypothetical protein
MSAIDPQKLAAKMTSQNQKASDKMYDRVSAIANVVGGRLTLNANDELVDAFEILLGTKPGTKEEAMTKLGVDGTNVSTGPAALPAVAGTQTPSRATMDDFWRVYEADGSTLALDIDWVKKTDDDMIRSAGLVPLIDPNTQQQMGLKTRPAPAPAQPAVTPKVKVVDKHGAVQRELDLPDFSAEAAKYQIIEVDPVSGAPTRVREVRFIGR